MIATAPGKLILAGEYAVLDGAPALVVAVNRRVAARRHAGPRGSSPFLLALANEIERRFGEGHPATRAALEITVDSSSFYEGGQKLGLGSSAAVTVAATALALAGDQTTLPVVDREEVISIASAAHASAQGARGSRGSGADIAASVHGGVIAFQRTTPDRVAWPSDAAASGNAIQIEGVVHGTADRLRWPEGVTLLPFFTGASADTPALVATVQAARAENRIAVEAALAAIDKAARAACQACAMRAPEIARNAFLAAMALAANAVDELAAATRVPLVPANVAAARSVMRRYGGTAKTTGAGGGDIAVAVMPSTEDVTEARRYLIEAGCQVLQLSVDTTGVDLQPNAQ